MTRRKWVLVLIAGVLMVVLSAGALIAQQVLNPTYEYYGEILNAAEFMELVNADTPLHCAQRAGTQSVLSHWFATDYACFNTPEEVDTYLGVVSGAEERSNP